MSYAVEFTQGAEDDLVRLYDYLLDRAKTLEELDVANEAVKVIRQAALSHLSTTPYSYRKVGARSTLRELIIPFGTMGYILRFDIRIARIGTRDRRMPPARRRLPLTLPGFPQVQRLTDLLVAAVGQERSFTRGAFRAANLPVAAWLPSAFGVKSAEGVRAASADRLVVVRRFGSSAGTQCPRALWVAQRPRRWHVWPSINIDQQRGGKRMFSHVMVGTNNIERSKRFYDAVLAVLGASEPFRNQNATGQVRLFYRHDGSSFCVSEPINGEPANFANGSTVGFECKSPEQVQQFHDTAVAHGGTVIEEPPGLRDGKLGAMYLAYVRDPDGNKLCALHRTK